MIHFGVTVYVAHAYITQHVLYRVAKKLHNFYKLVTPVYDGAKALYISKCIFYKTHSDQNVQFFIRSKTGILDATSFKYFSLVGFTCLMLRIFNGDRSQNISHTPYKLLNILMYRSPFCIIIHYRSYKVTKMVMFLGHLVYVSCIPSQTYSYSMVLYQVF